MSILDIVKQFGACNPGDPKCYTSGLDDPTNGQDLMGDIVKNIFNVVIGVVGLIAVVMIVIGGISYTTSAGDSGKVKKAKDTILYGIVGLVISLLAFAIVNFVIGGLNI